MESEVPTIAADVFRNVLSNYPTGVSIVTGDVPGQGPVGLVVGTFTSLSLEPALVSFMPAKSSTSWPKIEKSGAFCVNVLGANQGDLCRKFSTPGGNKFDGVEWTPTVTGSPLLSGVMAWVDCRIEQVFDSGDHQIVVGRVVDLRVETEEPPMTFLRGSFGKVSLHDSAQTGPKATSPDGAKEQLAGEVAQALGLDAFESRAWAESRDQILARLLVGFIEALLGRFDEAVDDAATPEKQLLSLVTVSLESLRDFAAAAILFQSERSSLSADNSERLEAFELEFRRRWTTVIERGTAAGSFASVDPRMAQQFLSDSLFSVARWFRDGGRLQRREVNEAYTALALNLVRR